MEFNICKFAQIQKEQHNNSSNKQIIFNCRENFVRMRLQQENVPQKYDDRSYKCKYKQKIFVAESTMYVGVCVCIFI